jgi:hypothetical protein
MNLCDRPSPGDDGNLDVLSQSRFDRDRIGFTFDMMNVLARLAAGNT